MFVSHGKLALLAQSFPTYFDQLPIGVRSDSTNATNLLHTSAKSPGVAYRVLTCELDYYHRLCFFLVAGLTARSYLYAHSRKSKRSRFVDAPYTIGGGGSTSLPYGTVSYNHNCNSEIVQFTCR